MDRGNRLRIELLGTSFTIKAEEDAAYLKRILWYLERKIEETRQRTPVTDPLKVSLLTAFTIIDELMREKARGGRNGALPEESDEIEKITLRLISEIEDALQE